MYPINNNKVISYIGKDSRTLDPPPRQWQRPPPVSGSLMFIDWVFRLAKRTDISLHGNTECLIRSVTKLWRQGSKSGEEVNLSYLFLAF